MDAFHKVVPYCVGKIHCFYAWWSCC